ncbi:hypothetical protein PABG_12148 [Paracoccidioides brasiliensis Pb03]|nr:hypothetical protein PABG_12148 [Paracoccidioides brasiliensis Pb03]
MVSNPPFPPHRLKGWFQPLPLRPTLGEDQEARRVRRTHPSQDKAQNRGPDQGPQQGVAEIHNNETQAVLEKEDYTLKP